ncbi:MAG: metal-dependent hydrolase [Candidatus Micrarchaeota archaeon]
MDWRSHIFIGAMLGAAAFFLLGEGVVSVAIGAAFAGLSALVPDLDHDSSKGRKWLDLGFAAFAFMMAYGSACGAMICLPGPGGLAAMAVAFLAMVGAYFILFRFFKPRHRGITHTLVACFVFGVLVYAIAGKELAIAGLAGYFSHLVADGHVKLV